MLMDVRVKPCKRAASPSGLPGLDWAINPYRGCAHACAYCYAQDVTRFEPSRTWGEVIEVKAGIVQCLKKEIEKGHMAGVFGVGTVTDPYQPLEKEYELTRGCLSLLKRKRGKVSILTKSNLVLRDIDILDGWEEAEVGVSIGCADPVVAKILEPGAPSPDNRFRALRSLVEKGINAYLMAAPTVGGLCDSREQIAELVGSASEAGIRRIIWDKYNQKPLASARMRMALLASGFEIPSQDLDRDPVKIRRVFSEECRRFGIAVTEAF